MLETWFVTVLTSQRTVGETHRVVDAIYVTQTSGSPQGNYTPGNIVISGNITLEGVTIAGTVKPFTQERDNRPGFYGVLLWSWRELYQ